MERNDDFRSNNGLEIQNEEIKKSNQLFRESKQEYKRHKNYIK